jgi:hypothetical protein
MKSGWETYKGKQIFVARYDHLTVAESRIEVAAKEIFKQPPNSVMMQVETTGTILAPEALGIYKNTTTACKPYLKKTAVMGMSGARMPIFDIITTFAGIRNTVKAFDDKDVEKAREWLLQP